MTKVTLPSCSQCGKPSVAKIGQQGLCVDCWYKFEVTRTMAMRLSAIGMNYAIDEMDSIAGFRGTSPKMQVPEIPKGPIILNNIKVDNSVVGAINTGNVQAIDVSLTCLHSGGNDKARDALKALTEEILRDKTMSVSQKDELLEQVAFLSEQSVAAAKDRKPGVIKATLAYFTQAAQTVSSIAEAWQSALPILKGLFGL